MRDRWLENYHRCIDKSIDLLYDKSRSIIDLLFIGITSNVSHITEQHIKTCAVFEKFKTPLSSKIQALLRKVIAYRGDEGTIRKEFGIGGPDLNKMHESYDFVVHSIVFSQSFVIIKKAVQEFADTLDFDPEEWLGLLNHMRDAFDESMSLEEQKASKATPMALRGFLDALWVMVPLIRERKLPFYINTDGSAVYYEFDTESEEMASNRYFRTMRSVNMNKCNIYRSNISALTSMICSMTVNKVLFVKDSCCDLTIKRFIKPTVVTHCELGDPDVFMPLKESFLSRRVLLPACGIEVTDLTFTELDVQKLFIYEFITPDDKLFLHFMAELENGPKPVTVEILYNVMEKRVVCSGICSWGNGSGAQYVTADTNAMTYFLQVYAELLQYYENAENPTSKTLIKLSTGTAKQNKKLFDEKIYVDHYTRRLPMGQTGSEEARVAAEKIGLMLPVGETYIKGYVRTAENKKKENKPVKFKIAEVDEGESA